MKSSSINITRIKLSTTAPSIYSVISVQKSPTCPPFPGETTSPPPHNHPPINDGAGCVPVK